MKHHVGKALSWQNYNFAEMTSWTNNNMVNDKLDKQQYAETTSWSNHLAPNLSIILGIFMFRTLSVIYFFSFCVSMLFYLGALQVNPIP
jgi:hypothetical protein